MIQYSLSQSFLQYSLFVSDFTLSNLDATVCCYHDNLDGCHANAFVTNSAVCVGLQHFTFTTVSLLWNYCKLLVNLCCNHIFYHLS